MVFLKPGRHRVTALSVRILTKPSSDATLEDTALFGHVLDVLETEGAFAKVRSPLTGKEGWVDSPTLKLVPVGRIEYQPTHWVSRKKLITFREADPKSETMIILPMFSFVALGDRTAVGASEFARVLGLPGVDAWVRMSGLTEIGTCRRDFVGVMEEFVGEPYVWGSWDSTLGFDCSGLLVLARLATGRSYCDRDTREQVGSTHLGQPLDAGEWQRLQRGDIIFFPGHVGVMVDERRCIHATDLEPHHRVLVQPLSEICTERGSASGQIVQIRRDPQYRWSHVRHLAAA